MSPELLALAVAGVALLAGPALAALIASWLCRPGRPQVTRAHEIPPAHDGAEIGYHHPHGWPVRIVQGLPVAVGPLGQAARWSACTGSLGDWLWIPSGCSLALEARERIRLEETQLAPAWPAC